MSVYIEHWKDVDDAEGCDAWQRVAAGFGWPFTYDHKCELFIDETIQVPPVVNSFCDLDMFKGLLTDVTVATESPCSTIADKALSFLVDDKMMKVTGLNKGLCFKIMFPPLFRDSKQRRNRGLQLRALAVMNTLMAQDIATCRTTANEFKDTTMTDVTRKLEKRGPWSAIARSARQQSLVFD